MNIESGLTREGLLEILDKNPNLATKEVRHALRTMKAIPPYELEATDVKVGDIYTSNGLNHPIVIIKIKKGIAYGVLMTSSEDYAGIMMKSNSRFFKEGFITFSISCIPIEKLNGKIKGIYDCPSDIREIIKKLKIFYKSLLNI